MLRRMVRAMPFVAAIPAAYLAAAGAASAVASAGVGAYSAIQSGQAQSRAANYQAQVAANNQITANQAATAAIDQGNAKAERDYAQGDQALGAARAALGASGVDLSSGSALDLQGDTGRTTGLNVQTDQYNSDLTAYSYRTQASSYGAQSQLDTMTGQNATAAAPIAALGSTLSGASAFASKWQGYQQQVGWGDNTAGGLG